MSAVLSTDDAPAHVTTEGPPQAIMSGELKLALSLWLLYHCVGIIVTPASESPLLEAVYRRLYSPYMEPLYMIHRYRFFAPEPGPGSLIRWTIERADGTSLSGEFPHRGIRPRLMYHRYFMLSERSVPFDPLEESEAAATTGEGDVPLTVVDSDWFEGYARHLIRKHDGVRITLRRVIHALPSAELIQQGRRLDEPEFYDVSEIGAWSRSELEAPDGSAPT